LYEVIYFLRHHNLNCKEFLDLKTSFISILISLSVFSVKIHSHFLWNTLFLITYLLFNLRLCNHERRFF